MIIYSVTIKIDKSVEKEWIKWMKDIHVPEVVQTGYFNECKILRKLPQSEEDIPEYTFHYYCSTLEDYETYNKTEAAWLREKHNKQFAGKFTAFRQILEVL